MTKECCKTCKHNQENILPRHHEEEPEEIQHWCDWLGEEIEDEEDETCFEWEVYSATKKD